MEERTTHTVRALLEELKKTIPSFRKDQIFETLKSIYPKPEDLKRNIVFEGISFTKPLASNRKDKRTYIKEDSPIASFFKETTRGDFLRVIETDGYNAVCVNLSLKDKVLKEFYTDEKIVITFDMLAEGYVKQVKRKIDKLLEVNEMKLREIVEDLKGGIPKEKIRNWLINHPNPDDDDVHALADKNGWEPHELEEIIYSITSKELKNGDQSGDLKSKVVQYAKTHGKSKDPTEKFDSKQIKMGRKVELEHGFGPEVATEIAKDHLKEKGDYYTYLKKMETKMDKNKKKKGEE
jgi:hypothetical protein